MGTFQSLRRAYGALKDSTMVGLAKVNSDYENLDIAIVKATNHVELPPKERHVRKIFSATSAIRPRADVAYCINALAKRLSKTRSWIVALKTLIVIHRALRDGDPTFREEIVNYSQRLHVLQIPKFKDDSSPLAWDCSGWVRAYALFLEERLECFRALRCDIESECLTTNSSASNKVLNGEQLLQQLPALQQFLYRLTACQPEGAAYRNHLIQYALSLVLKESFKLYSAISDGISNLVDVFFDMPKHNAMKALQIYGRAGLQAKNLADLYDYCRGLELARNFQFPSVRHPPISFLYAMEDYIIESPQAGSVNNRSLQQQESSRGNDQIVEEKKKEMINTKEGVKDSPLIQVEDDIVPKVAMALTHEPNPKALEESNARALAIIPDGLGNQVSTDQNSTLGSNSLGWEVALLTTPSTSSNLDCVPEPKMGGGFDNLLLDSLYQDDVSRKSRELQNPGYVFGQAGANLKQEQQAVDPFIMSNGFAPPTSVRMAHRQQQMVMQQQRGMYYPQQQQQQNMMMALLPYDSPQTSCGGGNLINMTQQPWNHGGLI